jgi:hypothetical protein
MSQRLLYKVRPSHKKGKTPPRNFYDMESKSGILSAPGMGTLITITPHNFFPFPVTLLLSLGQYYRYRYDTIIA